MTVGFRLALIWIVGSVLAVMMAMTYLPVSFVDGHYVPAGDDAFYHARRILDTVEDPAAFYEFDPRIHYPEGSLIPWPWGYDYLTARIVRIYMQISGATDPMAVLAYVPVAAVALSMLLILGIARAVRLSLPLAAVAVLATALSPLTVGLHGVGAVDHHFVEYAFVLAITLAGVHLLREPGRPARAVALGCVSGFAVAFHNGLFILQLPLIVTAGLLWLRGESLPRKTALAYGAAVLLSTLLAVAPSSALWRGEFQFYLLSWFHVWVAICSAAMVLAFSFVGSNRRNALGLVLLGAVLVLPLARHLTLGLGFVAAGLEGLQGIDETQGLFALAMSPHGATRITQQYTYLIWLAPLWLLVALTGAVKATDRSMSYFWIAASLGLTLLLLQLRFHYFGSFALYLTPLLLLERLAQRADKTKRLVWIAAPVGLALALYPSLQVVLLTQAPVALSTRYEMTRAAYPVLAQACEERPGVVLASWDDGHYVRYHTACSVIADNFMLTPQHMRKFQEVQQLLKLSPAELLVSAPHVRYVLARLNLIYALDPLGRATIAWGPEILNVNPRLVSELVLGAPAELPKAFRPLLTVWLSETERIPVAVLYEIVSPPSGPTAATMSAHGAAN
jgi:asparagine N-glycosylation enzyme membrane subunit Stt3